MVYNVLLVGVGGEGVLSSSVVLARAVNFFGYEVKGAQLHGLAQRGDSIPVHVKFGKKVFSPRIPRGKADLIIGLEPAETLKACYFADKKLTNFVIDSYPVVSVYSRLNREKYPKISEVEKMLRPFAKKIIVIDASNICNEKLGSPVYGNVMMLGISLANGLLPISKKALVNALKRTFPGDLENNIKALEMGLKI